MRVVYRGSCVRLLPRTFWASVLIGSHFRRQPLCPQRYARCGHPPFRSSHQNLELALVALLYTYTASDTGRFIGRQPRPALIIAPLNTSLTVNPASLGIFSSIFHKSIFGSYRIVLSDEHITRSAMSNGPKTYRCRPHTFPCCPFLPCDEAIV